MIRIIIRTIKTAPITIVKLLTRVIKNNNNNTNDNDNANNFSDDTNRKLITTKIFIT